MRSSVAKEKAKDKNTTIVRLKREGLRFELSCHRDHIPSKATLADPKAHIDFDEVLVNDAIFANAAKSEVAKPADVEKAFKDVPNTSEGKDTRAVMRFILTKGEVLKSQEDRTEEMEGALALMAKVAQKVAASTHVFPTEAVAKFVDGGRKNPEKLSGLRLERYAAADIERELKNIKFRPANGAGLDDAAADAIHALWASKALPILRDAFLVTVVPEGSATAATVQAAAAQLPHGFVKVVASSAKETRLLIDASVKNLLPKGHFGDAIVEVSKEIFVPRLDNDELASVAPGTAVAHPPAAHGGPKAAAAAAAAGGKPSAKAGATAPGGKKSKKSADSDDDDEAAAASALEAQLAKLKAEDSDDDGKKKGGKKAAAKKAPAPAPKAKAAASAPAQQKKKWEPSDDDEASEASEDEAPAEMMKPKKRK